MKRLKNERFDCLRPVGMDKKVVIKPGHHLDLLEKRGFLNMFQAFVMICFRDTA